MRGKNETDSCGKCLDPKLDQLQFNKCPKILDVDVKAITGDESTPMCLTIAALKKRIECYLQRENERCFFYSLFKNEMLTLNLLHHLFNIGSIFKNSLFSSRLYCVKINSHVEWTHGHLNFEL